MKKYSDELERQMKAFYDSLSEKDRRCYAAVEAAKLGHGGVEYIARLLGCDPKTIALGRKELEEPPDLPPGRNRHQGGGRKPCIETMPDLEQNFLDVLKEYTAGDPMREQVKWTNLTQQEIADLLAEKGTPVSVTVVKQLLKKHKFVKRKAKKSRAMGQSANRNAQFENIARLKQEYEADGNPVVSIDTKKKEFLGNYYRDGKIYTTEPQQTFDHDFGHAAEGVVIPHGLYDPVRNVGHINLGLSRDTSEFACDSVYQWWMKYGRKEYLNPTSILILCDGGGSNNSTHYIFKADLQKLADRIGIEIRIAHYPPYTSKYSPIEHRLFPHITRACQGVIFRSVEIVKELMEKAKTNTGLQVSVDIIDKIYETGRKVSDSFKEEMKIIFDEFLPKWNYTAVPSMD